MLIRVRGWCLLVGLLFVVALPCAVSRGAPDDEATGTVEVHVVAPEGRSVPGAEVLLDGEHRARSGPGGVATFEEVAVGAHYIQARVEDPAEGLLGTVAQVRVPRAGERVRVEAVLAREARVEVTVRPPSGPDSETVAIAFTPPGTTVGPLAGPRRAPAIPGRFSGLHTEHGWQGEVQPSLRPELYAHEGNYSPVEGDTATLDGLVPGRYLLVLRHYYPETLVRTRWVELSAGLNRVRFDGEEPGAVRVRVADPIPDVPSVNGRRRRPRCTLRPAEPEGVYWWRKVWDTLGTRVGSGDELLIPSVPPGRYRAEVGWYWEGGATRIVEVVSGQTTEVRLEVPPRRAVPVRADERFHYEMRGLPLAPPYARARQEGSVLRWRAVEEPITVVAWSTDWTRVDRRELDGTEREFRPDLREASQLVGRVVAEEDRSAGAGVQVRFTPDHAPEPLARLWTMACGTGIPTPPDNVDPVLLETDEEGRFGPAVLSPGTWHLETPGAKPVRVEVGRGEELEATLRLGGG